MCSYVTIIGDALAPANIGAIAGGDFNFTAPATDWYYVLAQCDMDQDATVDSFYFSSSESSEVFFIRQGK